MITENDTIQEKPRHSRRKLFKSGGHKKRNKRYNRKHQRMGNQKQGEKRRRDGES